MSLRGQDLKKKLYQGSNVQAVAWQENIIKDSSASTKKHMKEK